jgi:hypothetical protein
VRALPFKGIGEEMVFQKIDEFLRKVSDKLFSILSEFHDFLYDVIINVFNLFSSKFIIFL